MTVLAKFTKACAVALALLISQSIACYATEEDMPDNIQLNKTSTARAREESRTDNQDLENQSCFSNCGSNVSACCSSTCNCFIDVIKSPHVWAHAIGITMMVAGSSMMGTADVTWESHESTCTDDDKYYDDDWYDGHRHRHYHSNTHDCTKTTCVGPGCGEYYGGMALLIVGGIIVIADWAIILQCDCSNGGRRRGGGYGGHNVRFDPHHNHGR